MQHILTIMLGLLLAAGCSSSDPAPPPVRSGFSISMGQPLGTGRNAPGLYTGQTAEFSVLIDGNTGPYTLDWDLGGAAAGQQTQLPAAGSSSIQVVFPQLSQPETFTAIVRVTDSTGRSASELTIFTVDIPLNLPPVINQLSYSNGTLTIRALDPEDDELSFAAVISSGAASISDPTMIDSRTARFSITADDTLPGAQFTVEAAVEDSAGHIVRRSLDGTIPPFSVAADTLYAAARQTRVKVGEPVRIELITGRTAQDFLSLSNCRFICTESASYVTGSLDIGATDQDPSQTSPADGVWAAIGADNLLLPPESLMQVEDQGDGLLRLDFNISPVGGNAANVEGLLLNFELVFNQPGTFELGFEDFNIVNRTYYEDAQQNVHLWSDITSSHPRSTVLVE